MRFERARTFCQTLRFRLTLWNTLLVLALLLVNLLAVREGLRWTLLRMVDAFLKAELTVAVGSVTQLDGQPGELRDELNRQATSHPGRRLFVQLLDGPGAALWTSNQSPPADVGQAPTGPRDVPATVGGYRVVCRDVAVPGRGTLTVRVGCSLERSRAALERFTEMLLGVGVLFLLAAPLGGYVLAGRATRPVARIITTTTRLNPTHLDERLPIRGTNDELDRLSHTINSFLDRIAAYVRQSHELTANAAHELRSPLTAMQSSLEVALNADRTTAEYQEVLSVLLEECGHMRVLVNQLLLLAEGDAGRLCLDAKPVRLDRLVATAVEMFRAVAETAGVELAAPRLGPVALRGDGNRLWQVVNNLLDNAVKFTPAGGTVSVSLVVEGKGGQGALTVADTGVGIAGQDLPRVFDRFFQGDKARDREAPSSRGVGLGLSICQAIVAAHGGTVEVASAAGKGSTFTVRLPGCSRGDSTEEPAPESRAGR
jgi:heavy metal sensor kinase